MSFSYIYSKLYSIFLDFKCENMAVGLLNEIYHFCGLTSISVFKLRIAFL